MQERPRSWWERDTKPEQCARGHAAARLRQCQTHHRLSWLMAQPRPLKNRSESSSHFHVWQMYAKYVKVKKKWDHVDHVPILAWKRKENLFLKPPKPSLGSESWTAWQRPRRTREAHSVPESQRRQPCQRSPPRARKRARWRQPVAMLAMAGFAENFGKPSFPIVSKVKRSPSTNPKMVMH